RRRGGEPGVPRPDGLADRGGSRRRHRDAGPVRDGCEARAARGGGTRRGGRGVRGHRRDRVGRPGRGLDRRHVRVACDVRADGVRGRPGRLRVRRRAAAHRRRAEGPAGARPARRARPPGHLARPGRERRADVRGDDAADVPRSVRGGVGRCERDRQGSPLHMFGVAGMGGIWAGGRATDAWGPVRTRIVGVGALLATMAALVVLWPLRPVPLVLVFAIVTVWGGAAFWNFPAVQSRLQLLARPVATQALALNTSGTYIGVAIGGATGGTILNTAGFAPRHDANN